jgi:hypothetical protein
VAVGLIVSEIAGSGERTRLPGLDCLARFRYSFYDSLAARADALFDLTDAVLCADGPVTSLVELSLAAEHRRGHGALYDGVNRTTRSAIVGIPSLRSFPFALGITTRRTSTGRNSPDFSASRSCPKKASTPTTVSTWAAVALSKLELRAGGLRFRLFGRGRAPTDPARCRDHIAQRRFQLPVVASLQPTVRVRP